MTSLLHPWVCLWSLLRPRIRSSDTDLLPQSRDKFFSDRDDVNYLYTTLKPCDGSLFLAGKCKTIILIKPKMILISFDD